MTKNLHGGAAAALLAALLIYAALPAPASATQIAGTSVPGTSVSGMRVVEAADHAELSVEIAAAGVIRIALENDRIARLIRGPDGFAAEHDPASGDLYLRPADGSIAADEPVAPVSLFLGTEKGFTYRLILTPTAGGAAQVLIRNPAAVVSASSGTAVAGDPRIGTLVHLIRAVARREPLGGYAVESQAGRSTAGLEVVEIWSGRRFTAMVLELGPDEPADAAALADRLGPGIAAAWVSGPGRAGGRLAVAVRESAPGPGQAGGSR